VCVCVCVYSFATNYLKRSISLIFVRNVFQYLKRLAFRRSKCIKHLARGIVLVVGLRYAYEELIKNGITRPRRTAFWNVRQYAGRAYRFIENATGDRPTNGPIFDDLNVDRHLRPPFSLTTRTCSRSELRTDSVSG